MIPEDSDLRTIPQILKTNILLLHHPREITSSIMYPDIGLTCFIIVIQQAPHPSSIASFSFARHVTLINTLAFQPFRWSWLQRMSFLEYWSHSYLQLNCLVTEVPNPGSNSCDLRMITTSIEALRKREKAYLSHFSPRESQTWELSICSYQSLVMFLIRETLH